MSIRAATRHLSGAERPRLAAKARLHKDRLDGGDVLLYPEGILLLNHTAASVLALCDGRRTFAELIATLSDRFQVSQVELIEDVAGLLHRLSTRGLLSLASEEVAS
jgi:pyrroloquinoline quinone biosynthesis protein D